MVSGLRLQGGNQLRDVVFQQRQVGIGALDCPGERGEDHRSEEHTSELQSPCNLVCRLLLEKKNNNRSSLRWVVAQTVATTNSCVVLYECVVFRTLRGD